jgi:hypothetical protein
VHVAKVTDGLVRHTHYLRYRLHHAGSKVFMLAVPSEALGLLITGADIARREEVQPGKWRIELASKVYEQPYSLQVSYETRFDQDNGEIALQTVRGDRRRPRTRPRGGVRHRPRGTGDRSGGPGAGG